MAGFALGVEDELGVHDPGGDPPWPETPDPRPRTP
jgi:hypothetical protein